MREEVDGGLEFATVILTRRLMLRPPSTTDQAAIDILAANPHVAENLAAAPGEWRGGHCASFAVVEREGNRVIGAASYGGIADRPGSVEIAIWVGEPHWGKGYATEASQAMIDHVFADRRTSSSSGAPIAPAARARAGWWRSAASSTAAPAWCVHRRGMAPCRWSASCWSAATGRV